MKKIDVEVNNWYFEMWDDKGKEKAGGLLLYPLRGMAEIEEDWLDCRKHAATEEAYQEWLAKAKKEYFEWKARTEEVAQAVKNNMFVIRQVEQHYENYEIHFYVYRSIIWEWLDGWRKFYRCQEGCYQAEEPRRYWVPCAEDYMGCNSYAYKWEHTLLDKAIGKFFYPKSYTDFLRYAYDGQSNF